MGYPKPVRYWLASMTLLSGLAFLPTLPPEAEAVVFRVAQEAIANTVKHAAAHTVRVALAYGPRSVRLAVTDDGRGFTVDPDFRAYEGHWGLLGMRERANQLHAKLTVESAVGAGTALVLRVPYRAARPRVTST